MKGFELFDSVKAGDELRDQVRAKKNENKVDLLNTPFFNYKPIYMITTEEYAQLRICHALLSELSNAEIIEISIAIQTQKPDGNGWEFPSKDESFDFYLDRVNSAIKDIVDIQTETNGLYGENGGEFFYRRNIHQAIELGLDVPTIVKSQFNL